jgi:hypothetical protein
MSAQLKGPFLSLNVVLAIVFRSHLCLVPMLGALSSLSLPLRPVLLHALPWMPQRNGAALGLFLWP